MDIQGDVLPLLNGHCFFRTMDGMLHEIDGRWDLIIAHPPCTYLTAAGNRWFNIERYGEKAIKRYYKRDEAAIFFFRFTEAECDHIAIENPIGYMSTAYRKPDQITQPYMFGDPERKSTCLWLKDLPLLKPTNIVKLQIIKAKNGKSTDSLWHYKTIGLSKEERSRERSKTFPGIAKAMAEQWSEYILKEKPTNKRGGG